MDKLLHHGREMDLTPEVTNGTRGVEAARAYFTQNWTVSLVYEPGDATRYRLRLIYDGDDQTILVQLHESWGFMSPASVRCEYLYTAAILRQAKIPLPVWEHRIDKSTGKALHSWTATVIERALYDLFSAEGGEHAFP